METMSSLLARTSAQLFASTLTNIPFSTHLVLTKPTMGVSDAADSAAAAAEAVEAALALRRAAKWTDLMDLVAVFGRIRHVHRASIGTGKAKAKCEREIRRLDAIFEELTAAMDANHVSDDARTYATSALLEEIGCAEDGIQDHDAA
jgi:hypothetical protein